MLRAFAALGVVVYHICKEAWHRGFLESAALYRLAETLQIGVDLFFIVSGFIIVYVSRDLPPGAAGLGTFLGKRLVRVVPIYWLFTLLTAAVILLSPQAMNHGAFSIDYLLASLAFLPWPSASNTSLLPLLGVGWTLNYEMFFYILYALLIGLNVRNRVRTLCLLLAALAILGWFVPRSLPQPWFWTRSIILEFAMGALLARLHLGGYRLPPRLAMALLATGILSWQVMCWTLPAFRPEWRGYTLGLAAAQIFAGACWLPHRAVQRKHGLRAVLLDVGDASYCLYLMHMFVIRPATLLFSRAGAPGAALVYVPFATLACLVAAILCHHYVERPLLRVGQRLGSARPLRAGVEARL
jgi:exopolysaccharide production protein ExoZ